jgi:peptidoglycan endopeptidase LytF
MVNRCPPGFRQYTIRAGDNFFRLALTFRTTVAAIASANPGVNPNALRVGQQICIPVSRARVGTCPRNWQRYTIKAGDTLSRIARQQGTTVTVLLNNNPGIDPNRLRIDQVICIPPISQMGPPPCPDGLRHYTIRRGDTLTKIAAERGTSVRVILRFNPSLDPNSLRVGQIICVP